MSYPLKYKVGSMFVDKFDKEHRLIIVALTTFPYDYLVYYQDWQRYNNMHEQTIDDYYVPVYLS